MAVETVSISVPAKSMKSKKIEQPLPTLRIALSAGPALTNARQNPSNYMTIDPFGSPKTGP